ncbi:MAG: T9SS type A sorting domain-containing protein, partial [Cryomorphaceae bacterium]
NNPPPFFEFDNIVEIDKVTGISTSFQPSLANGSILRRIRDIEIFNGDLYVAGLMYYQNFELIDFGEAIGQIDGSTGQFTSVRNAGIRAGGDQPFNTSLFVQGKDLVLKDSLLYFASEAFSGKYNFDEESYTSVYSSTDWYELTCCEDAIGPRWDPLVSANAIAVDSEGTVYIGGDYEDIIGRPRLGFAAIFEAAPPVECEATSAGTTSTTSITRDICLNNEELDIVQAEVSGNTGNSVFVLHDSDYNIFSARQTGTFKPDNHPAGNYFVSHVAYAEDEIEQVTNLNDLTDCISISNSFPVTSFRAEAGQIGTTDPKDYCVGDLPATINFDRINSSGINQGFVLLNNSNQIIGVSIDGSFVLEDLNPGRYKVASVSTDETVVLEDIQASNLNPCFDYSNIVKIDIETCEELLITSNPNPVVDVSNVSFTTTKAETVQLELFDLTGKRIGLIYAGMAPGQTPMIFQFDTSSLPQGVYIYKLTTESEVKTTKFLKN